MTSLSPRTFDVRMAGTLGVAAAVTVAVLLGIHPPGDTALYANGVAFTEHVDGFWVLIHTVGAAAFVAMPVVLWVWVTTLGNPRSRTWG